MDVKASPSLQGYNAALDDSSDEEWTFKRHRSFFSSHRLPHFTEDDDDDDDDDGKI